MKYKKNGLLLILLSCTILFLALIGITSANAETFNYYVKTVIPENQINKKQDYFDLKMTPNQKQELVIQLRNDTDKAVIVEPKISAATTGMNGVVEYIPSKSKLNSSAKYNIADLVKSSVNEINIPAKSTVDYKLNVTMPEKSYDGVLAGGISFKEKNQNQPKNDPKTGLAIENQFSYVVGILLTEDSTIIQPKIEFGKVTPGQVNARNVINSEIENTKPVYINKLQVTTEIQAKGSNDSLYKSSKKEMQMAPNSTMIYPTSLNGKKLKPGVYEIHTVAKSGQYTWESKKEFTISGKEASTLNKKDVTVKQDHNWGYVIVGSLILLLALIISFLIWRKKKKINEGFQ